MTDLDDEDVVFKDDGDVFDVEEDVFVVDEDEGFSDVGVVSEGDLLVEDEDVFGSERVFDDDGDVFKNDPLLKLLEEKEGSKQTQRAGEGRPRESRQRTEPRDVDEKPRSQTIFNIEVPAWVIIGTPIMVPKKLS